MSLPLSFLWRASLLALCCAAAPNQTPPIFLKHRSVPTGAASQPNASKLARHGEWGAVRWGGAHHVDWSSWLAFWRSSFQASLAKR
ncbi:hypothetical protein CXQ82_13340 [Pseudomonas sp. S09G 359]|nr:hypothetical protein CXQ82_13340 [Pseudomonas sp. S09G 359]